MLSFLISTRVVSKLCRKCGFNKLFDAWQLAENILVFKSLRFTQIRDVNANQTGKFAKKFAIN